VPAEQTRKLRKLFHAPGVLLELNEDHPSFEEYVGVGQLICDRIRTIRPYLEKLADFMYESENLTRLRTEVNFFLYDEQTEFDAYGKTWKAGGTYEHDPLSGIFLLLSFGDMRGPRSGPKFTGKRRYLIIWVYDFNDSHKVSLGNAFLKMRNYEVGA
jgi:hypothetical protein